MLLYSAKIRIFLGVSSRHAGCRSISKREGGIPESQCQSFTHDGRFNCLSCLTKQDSGQTSLLLRA